MDIHELQAHIKSGPTIEVALAVINKHGGRG